MKGFGKGSCTYEGEFFSNGEKLCVSDRCMVCRDGEWEEKTDLFVL